MRLKVWCLVQRLQFYRFALPHQKFAASNFIPFLLAMQNCLFISTIPQIPSALYFINEITLHLS